MADRAKFTPCTRERRDGSPVSPPVAESSTAAEPKAGRSRPRLQELDSLRGIAACIVVLFHLTYWYDWFHVSPVHVWWGHYGVELFFVISGFVILMTIENCRSTGDFVISRIARLYPAYWCAVVLTTSVALILKQSDHISAGRFIANLTMFHSYMLANIHSIDGSYWTLARELVFYMMMAVWYRFRSARFPDIEWYALCWMVIAAVIHTGLYLRHVSQPPEIVTSPLLISYGQFFIIGMCLYRLESGKSNRLTLVVLGLACLMSLFGGGPKSLNVHPLPYFFVTCMFTAIVWAAVRFKPAVLRHRALLFLGGISYPLYLVHDRIGMELLSLAHARGYTWWSTTPLIIGLLVLIAYVLHISVEVPGRTFLRAQLARLFQRDVYKPGYVRSGKSSPSSLQGN